MNCSNCPRSDNNLSVINDNNDSTEWRKCTKCSRIYCIYCTAKGVCIKCLASQMLNICASCGEYHKNHKSCERCGHTFCSQVSKGRCDKCSKTKCMHCIDICAWCKKCVFCEKCDKSGCQLCDDPNIILCEKCRYEDTDFHCKGCGNICCDRCVSLDKKTCKNCYHKKESDKKSIEFTEDNPKRKYNCEMCKNCTECRKCLNEHCKLCDPCDECAPIVEDKCIVCKRYKSCFSCDRNFCLCLEGKFKQGYQIIKGCKICKKHFCVNCIIGDICKRCIDRQKCNDCGRHKNSHNLCNECGEEYCEILSEKICKDCGKEKCEKCLRCDTGCLYHCGRCKECPIRDYNEISTCSCGEPTSHKITCECGNEIFLCGICEADLILTKNHCIICESMYCYSCLDERVCKRCIAKRKEKSFKRIFCYKCQKNHAEKYVCQFCYRSDEAIHDYILCENCAQGITCCNNAPLKKATLIM
jgi:hypothetical protein